MEITQSQQSGFSLCLGPSLVFPPLENKDMGVFCLKIYQEPEDNLRVISKLSQEELVMTACLPESHQGAERSSQGLSSSGGSQGAGSPARAGQWRESTGRKMTSRRRTTPANVYGTEDRAKCFAGAGQSRSAQAPRLRAGRPVLALCTTAAPASP